MRSPRLRLEGVSARSGRPRSADATLAPLLGHTADAHRPRADFASALDFYRALTAWLGGWEAISERSRQSLGDIGTRLCGYPQLASEARFAAGIVGHMARRLLLGERVAPFQGHLDLDALIPTISEGT